MSFLKSSMFRLPGNKRFDYKPRYYDPEKEARKKKRVLFMERGSFYKRSENTRLVGAFSEKEYAFRTKVRGGGQVGRTLTLIAMMGIIALFFIGKLSGIIALSLLMILMIIFVKNVNKL